jgi:hypothetical protein
MKNRSIAWIAWIVGLLCAASPLPAQTVVQVSELTSTETSERLILTSQVTRSETANTFEWRFTLRNPEGNTTHLAAFTVAPRCDLTNAVVTGTPEGWTFARSLSGELKIVWQWVPSPAVNPTNAAQQIDPGETFVFSFLLNQPAQVGGGVASATNRFGFSGPTVSCAPTTPPGPPPGTATPVPPTGPTITSFNFEVLQAKPCSFKRHFEGPQLPADITWTGCCIGGDPAGGIVMPSGQGLACRFVGNVLCFDPGPNGDFASFAIGGPAGTDPVVQGVKLIKTLPAVSKCPDQFPPGETFVQTPVNGGIRTFFPLKFTPCDTVFTLEIEFASVSRTVPRVPREVRVNRFNYTVTVRPETLEWVVDALHCEPLGVCEVPCITDEGVFQTLLTQARAVAAAGTDVVKLNTALDNFEATVIRNCTFQQQVFQTDDQGNVLPCAIFAGQLPGNSTVGGVGFGIVDTIENPCCCKLITDIVCLKKNLIGKP